MALFPLLSASSNFLSMSSALFRSDRRFIACRVRRPSSQEIAAPSAIRRGVCFVRRPPCGVFVEVVVGGGVIHGAWQQTAVAAPTMRTNVSLWASSIVVSGLCSLCAFWMSSTSASRGPRFERVLGVNTGGTSGLRTSGRWICWPLCVTTCSMTSAWDCVVIKEVVLMLA